MSLYQKGLTLKALLENPVRMSSGNTTKSSEESPVGKKQNRSDVEVFSGQSAFLGPTLWDRTLPLSYDDFKLEYLDLDDFLSENGVPGEEDAARVLLQRIAQAEDGDGDGDASDLGAPLDGESSQSSCGTAPSPGSSGGSSSSSSSSSSSAEVRCSRRVPKCPSPSEAMASPTGYSSTCLNAQSPPTAPCSPAGSVAAPCSPAPSSTSDGRMTTAQYRPSSTDLPQMHLEGEEDFDPRKRPFSDDELSTQPMLKKSKKNSLCAEHIKIFVADDLKDDKYWARRNKNNQAAKRSRDARRVKENQVMIRASYLEAENNTLHEQLERSRTENLELRKRLAKYECPTT